jgi:hypothetical protein
VAAAVTHHTAMRPSGLTTRISAMAAAFLVFALSIFSASPTLHAWLHSRGSDPHVLAAQAADHGAPAQGHHQQDHGDDGCAVTMFAHGALALLVIFVLARDRSFLFLRRDSVSCDAPVLASAAVRTTAELSR